MTLHENKDLFLRAIRATAEQRGIVEVYVEKDYWLTAALHKIFHSPAGSYAVFKGGTALSKAHRLVERFSEDIDLVVLHAPGESSNSLKNKLKGISGAVTELIPEIEIDGITNKKGMIRKTAHTYEKIGVAGVYGQVRDTIIVEATWLGTSEPCSLLPITSYITEMMIMSGQDLLVEKYGLAPFLVNVLSKERTFCEKIMSLVRFSLTKSPYTDLANKIRHVYDLYMMLKDPAIQLFLDHQDFDFMLTLVGTDDLASFKNNNAWLINPPWKAIIFDTPADTWQRIRSSYQNNFGSQVIGMLPEEHELVVTLAKIGRRLRTVPWHIQP